MAKGDRIRDAEKAYQFWIRLVKHDMVDIGLPHPYDDEKFYKFMRKFMKAQRGRKRGYAWFRQKLEHDLPNKMYEAFIRRYSEKFDTIFHYLRGI